MNEKRIKKPNTLVWGLFVFASKFLSKFMLNLKVNKEDFKKVKGPCLILANHETSIDFICLAAALKRKAHFVISNSFYQINPIKPLLDASRVIPKQQFQTSLSDMRIIKGALENEIPLIIYPAGMMTENGVTTPIPLATGKTAKWLNQDVYIAYTKGSYLTNPKWGKKWRKGRIDLSIKKLYSKEELQQTDAEIIQKRIEEELYYDAYENQEKLMIKYKGGDNIEGLEKVLYWCPKCNSYHTNEVIDKNKLVCSKCGNTAIANEYGFLEKGTEDSVIFKHPSKWSLKIKNLIKEDIINNDNFCLEDTCEIQMINFKKKKYETVGHGKISLNKTHFHLIGEANGEAFDRLLDINLYPILPFKAGERFELQDRNAIYRIILGTKEEATRWISAVEILYKLNHNIEIEKQPTK